MTNNLKAVESIESIESTETVQQFLSQSDLADYAQVSLATVANWANDEEKGLPAPVAIVSRGRTKIWALADVEDFIEKRKAEALEKNASKIAKLKADLARLMGEPVEETVEVEAAAKKPAKVA